MTDHTCSYCGHTGPDVSECDPGRVPVVYTCEDGCHPCSIPGAALYESHARRLYLETEMQLIQQQLDRVPGPVEGLTMTPSAKVAWLAGYYLEVTNGKPTREAE